MGFIYIIKNKINDKVYVGQTTNTVQYRFNQHLTNANLDYKTGHLYNAMRKYGKDNFYVETIEEIPNELLDEREIYWIAYYNSFQNGYNLTIGGEGNKKINYENVIQDWNNGFTVANLKQKYNISNACILKIFNLYNISFEERMIRFGQSKQQNNDEKILELWNLGYGIREIKRKFGGSRDVIKKQLLRQGITEEEIWQRGLAKRGRPVEQYSLNNEYIATYNTAAEAARALGHPDGGHIGDVAKGRRATAYGYKWKYK